MGSQASSDGRRIVKPALTTPRARPRPKRCRAPPLADRQPVRTGSGRHPSLAASEGGAPPHHLASAEHLPLIFARWLRGTPRLALVLVALAVCALASSRGRCGGLPVRACTGVADLRPTGNQLTANAVPTLPGEGKGPAPRARLERAAYRL